MQDSAAPTDEGFIEIVVREDIRIRVGGAFDPVVLRRAIAALGSR